MRILVVDDSALMLSWVRTHLVGVGFEVETLQPKSLFDVLSGLRTHRPGLLILDYEMPGCNGESVLRAIREDPDWSGLPVLLFSSHREADLVERLARWDLVAYLTKPASVEHLQATVAVECLRHGFELPDGAQHFLKGRT